MSREIKFIIGNKDNEGEWEWSFPLTIADLIDGGHIDTFDENTTVREYTGLQDKNGKEIYEGDVVSVNIPTPAPAYSAAHDQGIGYVEWDSQGADYSIIRGGVCILGLGFNGATYEVIGNIYENPDLLPTPKDLLS